LFIRGYDVGGFEIIAEVDAHVVLLQVTDMTEATLHGKVFPQDGFDGFGFSR